MTAALIQTADAVAADLNSADFTAHLQTLGIAEVFQAERSYADWDDDLDETDCLKVDVVPFGIRKVELETFGSLRVLPEVSVGVRKRFGPKDQTQGGRIDRAKVDQLVLFTEAIYEFFAAQELSTYAGSMWKEASVPAAWIREDLRNKNQFTSIQRLVFYVPRELP